MDSQAPNKVVKEWLETKDYDYISQSINTEIPELTFIEKRKSGISYGSKGMHLGNRWNRIFP